MSREKRAPRTSAKPCCLVSEILEEAGIDRERARQIRRQVLEGIILMCQWQLQRMDEDRKAAPAERHGHKVEVE